MSEKTANTASIGKEQGERVAEQGDSLPICEPRTPVSRVSDNSGTLAVGFVRWASVSLQVRRWSPESNLLFHINSLDYNC